MLLLAVGSAAAAIATWWLYYVNTVGWKGTTIAAARFGNIVLYEDLTDLVSLREVRWRGQWEMEFASGNRIYVSEMSHGFDELGEVLDQVLR